MNKKIIFLDLNNILFFLIYSLIIVLPNLEAPKNIIILLFVILWSYLFFKGSEPIFIHGKWNLVDSIFLTVLLTVILISFNSYYIHEQPVNGSSDLVRFSLFGWLISRTKINIEQAKRIVVISAISVTPVFFVYFFNSSEESHISWYIQLHSIGHVNHTAIYLLAVFSITLSFFFFRENFNKITNFSKAILLLFLTFTGVVIFATNSRAAVITFIIILALFALYAIRFYNKLIKLIVFLIGLFFVIQFTYFTPNVINKIVTETSFNGDDGRQRLRNFSYELFKLDPVLGTGIGNFPNFSYEDIKEPVINEKGEAWWNENYKEYFYPYAHPHNTYYAFLTGGGVVLFLVFLWFWIFSIHKIFSNIFKKKSDWIEIASLNIVIVNLLIGLVNTTFENELAILSMLILGMLFSKLRLLESSTTIK